MEWREQSTLSCKEAFTEAQRWVEDVTRKKFGSSNFRSALENGVLLCDLLNKLKPGIIKRVNRLSTPIAGLDNVNVFLKACGKLGLNDSQLFHPGDLQDVSTRVTVRREETSRRLKNVLITIYWLGRKAQADSSYSGPQLNFKAFEGLLGVALSKALEESAGPKPSVRDSGYVENWYPEREDLFTNQQLSYRREDSVESIDSVESRTLSVASDYTLVAGSEGFGSDAEAEHCFRMSEGSRSETHSGPVREKTSVSIALRRKQGGRYQEGGRSHVSQLPSENERGLFEPHLELPPVSAFHQRVRSYQSDSDSDSDRPEPDLVQDDLASRRFRSTTCSIPTNFAVPGNLRSPRSFPTVTPSAQRLWVTMSDATRVPAVPHTRLDQSSLEESRITLPPCSTNRQVDYDRISLEDEFLLCALPEDSSESDEGRGFADPVQDDLYARRVLQATHQTSSNTDSDKFLPKFWTPEEDAHVRKIRQGSQRRPWYKKMQGFRVPARHSRRGGSKSMSDLALEAIPQESDSSIAFDSPRSWQSQQGKPGEVVLHPSALDQVQAGQIQHFQTRVKDSEARWQDDLNKWKSRRMTANLDLRRKKEEREQLELFAGSGGADGVRTAVLTGVREESDQCVPQCYPHQQPQTRPQEPSYAQEPSTKSLPPSQPPPSALKEDPQLASLASPPTSSCSMPGTVDSGPVVTMQVDPLSTPVGLLTNGACSLSDGANRGDLLANDRTERSTSIFFSPPESTFPLRSTGTELSQQDAAPIQRAKSLEGIFSGGTRMSATLPRGFRRSEGGSRLSTGVTPRPFGSKTAKVSSLPRFCSMDDSHTSLIKGQRERPQLPASFTCQEKVIIPANKVQKKENEKEVREEENHSAPKIHSFMSASMVATSLKQRAVSESGEARVGHADMRVSLNQKPGSGKDFGFQAHWDSTGACIKSVQPGSPAQLCHLQAGDEIVAVGGQRVAEMSYEQWKANMDAALKEGSLLMDIRRHGQNGHPEHCVTDSSSSSLPVEKAAELKVNGHAGNGLPAKAVTRNFRDIPTTQKSKEYERIVMNNRKRRIEFFMQKGGSESAISDLQVPSISASSSRWSWDTEEERKRQEKWQMEQERLLQEKYRRDQERLEEEWRRAQLAAAGEEYCGPEPRSISMSNGSSTQYTPPSFQYPSASSTLSTQYATEVTPLQSRQVTMQISTGLQTKEEWGSSTKTNQWPRESCGFAKLTSTDRQKSKSTPALDSSHKQDSRVLVKSRGRLSRAEKDRQQILEEMRKRTPLNTDSSWIRQRSTCTVYKEPINVAPIRRYESLDNLHSSSNSLSRQFSTMSNPARPHSALDNITPYRGYSGRCSLGPGAAIFSNTSRQSSWSRPSSTSSTPPITPGAEEMRPSSQHGRLVSGRRLCSRCEQLLGKGAAMVIDTLDLCFHIGCFKCVSCRTDLSRGSQSRAQVRVRHRQLFCDTCYSRLRVRTGIPK